LSDILLCDFVDALAVPANLLDSALNTTVYLVTFILFTSFQFDTIMCLLKRGEATEVCKLVASAHMDSCCAMIARIAYSSMQFQTQLLSQERENLGFIWKSQLFQGCAELL